MICRPRRPPAPPACPDETNYFLFVRYRSRRRVLSVGDTVEIIGQPDELSLARLDGLFSHAIDHTNRAFAVVSFTVRRTEEPTTERITGLPLYIVSDHRAVVGINRLGGEKKYLVPRKDGNEFMLVPSEVTIF